MHVMPTSGGVVKAGRFMWVFRLQGSAFADRGITAGRAMPYSEMESS
jgi:hypothetical protein